MDNAIRQREEAKTDALIAIADELVRLRESHNLRLQNIEQRIRKLIQERPP